MTEIVGFDFAARIRGIALKLGSCKRANIIKPFLAYFAATYNFFVKKERTTI